jgi:hypothetical protein
LRIWWDIPGLDPNYLGYKFTMLTWIDERHGNIFLGSSRAL